MKYLKDPASFLVVSGLLFEINRRVLHPFGLALTLEFPSEGKPDPESTTMIARVLDRNPEDSEDIYFDNESMQAGEAKLAATVKAFKNAGKFETRHKALGFVVQGCSPDQMAQRAYIAYGESTGGLNFRGEPMPLWLDLPEKIRQAWRAAVKAVVEP